MLTEEDLKGMRRIKYDYQRKESESNGSSALDQRSEDELYISRYFLNESFKILHIDISGTQIMGATTMRGQSYMVYIIKVLTEEFSYEMRRRYSQFLKLYNNVKLLENLRNNNNVYLESAKININKISKFQYTFPIKKLSSSLLHFFNMANKQKLAEQRRSDLSAFLNQIKNNYYKFPDQFIEDFIELLKFIDMKQQHQKYWRRKQGRLIELSSITLKDSNLPNISKDSQKKGQVPVNVQYLTELLQHQINKINLAIIAKQSICRSIVSSRDYEENSLLNDPLVTDQIIKNVDCIKDIVLQLKRKITYDHIRCILKGKDIKQDGNLSKSKKGLIEYSLRFTNNQLVTMHIIKTLINVLMNSQCNYSSEAFIKILAELDLGLFSLKQEKQSFYVANKQLRQWYYKLLRLFLLAKQQYGNNKKCNSENFPKIELMGLMLASMFQTWANCSQKNRQFKLRDEQKQWTIVIENQPKFYNNLKEIDLKNQQQIVKSREDKIIGADRSQNCVEMKRNEKVRQKKHILKLTKQNKFVCAELTTKNEQGFSQYHIRARLKLLEYNKCVQLIKEERKWNPLLSRTEVDIYSHTRKDFIKIPGKQQKMFRFVQTEEIQMSLQDDALVQPQQIINYEHFIPIDASEDPAQKQNKSVKMSTQTMPSASGSCAHEIHPEDKAQEEDLALSRLSQQYQLVKQPPKQRGISSYSQRVKVTRNSSEGCQVEIDLIFKQPSVIKYFSSEIDGSTLCIWNGFCEAVEKHNQGITELCREIR